MHWSQLGRVQGWLDGWVAAAGPAAAIHRGKAVIARISIVLVGCRAAVVVHNQISLEAVVSSLLIQRLTQLMFWHSRWPFAEGNVETGSPPQVCWPPP
jgi:hypothetical protein